MREWLRARGHNLAHVLTRPWLLWTLAAVFWARLVYLVAITAPPGDGSTLLATARLLVHDPRQLYVADAAFLQERGMMAIHGWSGPPGAMFLVVPFALLPDPLAVRVWMIGDLVALAAGLLVIYRLVRPAAWRRPLFWVVAAFFPPTFADLLSGQWGGYLLLLAAGTCWLSTRERSGWAGVLAGAGTAIKLYPAGMLFGTGPRRLPGFLAGLAAAAGLITLAGFALAGIDRIGFYVTRVLLPSVAAPNPDCAVNSPRTLLERTIGGQPYPYLEPGDHMVWLRLPIHQPQLAQALIYLLLAAIVVVTVWAARRSGWHPVYGASLGFALGALLPGEVNTYQVLPLLPVVLVTGVRAAELGRHRVLVVLAVGLLALTRQPCLLPYPDVWTLAILLLFATCAWNGRLFARR